MSYTWRVLALWSLCWVTALGCSSKKADSLDGAVDGLTCSCARVEGELETIRLSWPCFCQDYGCPATTEADLCASNMWSLACGLTVASSENVGGVQKTVFNATGAVVGRRYATDVYYDTCHGADIGFAAVESGQLPDASCTAVLCSCAGGVVTCPAPDAAAP